MFSICNSELYLCPFFLYKATSELQNYTDSFYGIAGID